MIFLDAPNIIHVNDILQALRLDNISPMIYNPIKNVNSIKINDKSYIDIVDQLP